MNITMTDAKALVLVKMKHRVYRNLTAFMKMRKMLKSCLFDKLHCKKFNA